MVNHHQATIWDICFFSLLPGIVAVAKQVQDIQDFGNQLEQTFPETSAAGVCGDREIHGWTDASSIMASQPTPPPNGPPELRPY